MTRVNMRKQDLQGYTGYAVLVGYTWVNRTKTRVNRVYSITTVNTRNQDI